MWVGIALALLSALWFAAAGALQHSATRSIALERGAVHGWLPVLGLLRRILASRVWWIGLALNGLGFLFHSAALHLGSITVVQALLSVQLMFALPFATARTRTLPLARDWIGTAAVCLGIVTLVAARGPVPQTLERQGLVPLFTAVAALAMAALLAAARLWHRTARTALVGVAAGVGFSVTATFIIIVADQIVHSGPLGALSHWHVYALAASGLVAAVIAQDAFASGSFPAALTAMTVADPIASWLWGALLFDRVPPHQPAALASLTAAAVLISAGVALLAYSPTLAAARR
jgi:drug/metabolite transporter (DMT)-like permease